MNIKYKALVKIIESGEVIEIDYDENGTTYQEQIKDLTIAKEGADVRF